MKVSQKWEKFMRKPVFKQPKFASGFLTMEDDLNPVLNSQRPNDIQPETSQTIGIRSLKNNVEGIMTVGPMFTSTSPRTLDIMPTTGIAKYIPNANLIHEQNIQDKISTRSKDQEESKFKLEKPEDLMNLIMQRYEKNQNYKKTSSNANKSFNTIIPLKSQLTPMKLPGQRRTYKNLNRGTSKPQSVKEKLFGSLFKKLPKDSVDLTDRQPIINQQTRKKPRRLPQNILQGFARLDEKGKDNPPTSQDLHRKFLQKIKATSNKYGEVLKDTVFKTFIAKSK